ncbi:TetR family transcriptional regulator [Virgisporangium aliadipatigenens]|uniref:TetR family transcriptional regulator n=1 Tax=Virgisporangium aliadipatigenens TaxID=741659 RepID=A0A8J4DSN2_9ACTN|nr:TetR family transcriptional regulator [Virgisporangium aliadipatigenens]GIJ48058.1 TetR family transcriptional regulator [Virgisporangium aliadipatigenens]
MTARPSLRERRKRRTREALIDSALDLFGRRGFDHVTLDELCEAAEVSKRTFFRTFTSKEHAAMATYQDMWAAALEALEAAPPGRRPLVDLMRDSLLAGLDKMDSDGWAERLRRTVHLSVATPAIEAHCLYFCHRTTEAALSIMRDRHELAAPKDFRVLLAMDIVVAAHQRSIARWAARTGEADRALLAADTLAAFGAIPDSLTVTGGAPAQEH